MKEHEHKWYIAYVFRNFFDTNQIDIIFKCDECDELLEKKLNKKELLND